MCRNATHCLTVGLWHPERTTLEPEENRHMEIVIKKKPEYTHRSSETLKQYQCFVYLEVETAVFSAKLEFLNLCSV